MMPLSDRQLVFEDSIEVDAPADRVWDVLTNPEFTKQYMFGCETISDWREGSPLIWKGAKDDKVYVKGEIQSIEPNKRLQYTSFDPNAPDHDERHPNYSTVTEELSESDGRTILRVLDGDFAKVKDGEARYERTSGGWKQVLPLLKRTAEQAG
jgi:uncharacterized protein YndB with AHSA1/START domain